MSAMRTFNGQCHCGRIAYSLEWPETAGLLPARRCDCTYCRRIDGAWTSHPDAKLLIHVTDESVVSRYRFGTKTADFIFCNGCGITLFAVCELEGSLRAVVNVHTIRTETGRGEVQADRFDWQDSSFEGEELPQRLQRRGERWIGEVMFTGRAAV